MAIAAAISGTLVVVGENVSRKSADVSGIPYGMDSDREEVDKILG
jgi:hypothetical protein